MNPTFQNPSIEKGRQGWDGPAAKLRDPDGQLTGHANHAGNAMNKSAGTFTQNIRAQNGNNVRVEPGRKFRVGTGNNFRGEPTLPEAFELTTKEWNERSASAFIEHMRDEALSLKELAQKLGCNDRTAENYVQGRTSPQGVYFLRSLAVVPEFEAEVRQVSQMATECDPRTNRAALELVRSAQRFLDARDRISDARMGTPSLNGSAGDEDQDLATGDLFGGQP